MSTYSVEGTRVVVDVTAVSVGQTTMVRLYGVSDGINTTDVSIPLSVLPGDTNGDRVVNAADALQTRSRSGQTTDATNFRSDVYLDGTVNGGDVIAVRSRSGASLNAGSAERSDSKR